jgi:hypothetical protein
MTATISVEKMLGATEQELQELAVFVAGSAFWSNMLHVENYDYNTFVKDLQQQQQSNKVENIYQNKNGQNDIRG